MEVEKRHLKQREHASGHEPLDQGHGQSRDLIRSELGSKVNFDGQFRPGYRQIRLTGHFS